MFFFWGPFFFIFPAIAVYYLVRHLLGPDRRGDRSKWMSELDDLAYPGWPDDQHQKGSTRVQIYKLAYKLKGRLTVSDIVIETGLDADEAEELIQSMVDNLRVRMEVMDDGLVVYEFPEIIARYKSQEGFDSDRSS
jgi:hypothetical protein